MYGHSLQCLQITKSDYSRFDWFYICLNHKFILLWCSCPRQTAWHWASFGNWITWLVQFMCQHLLKNSKETAEYRSAGRTRSRRLVTSSCTRFCWKLQWNSWMNITSPVFLNKILGWSVCGNFFQWILRREKSLLKLSECLIMSHLNPIFAKFCRGSMPHTWTP